MTYQESFPIADSYYMNTTHTITTATGHKLTIKLVKRKSDGSVFHLASCGDKHSIGFSKSGAELAWMRDHG